MRGTSVGRAAEMYAAEAEGVRRRTMKSGGPCEDAVANAAQANLKQKAFEENAKQKAGQENAKQKAAEENAKQEAAPHAERRPVWSGLAWNTMVGLLVAAFFVRFALINEPSEVVFDEVHFGGFASNYLRREYFFDVHPPLGKLVIAGAGKLLGYDGGFPFANIGDSYVNTAAPYVALRTFMVVLSVASIGMAYATVLEMGYGVAGAASAAVLLVFDNALTVQSRFILLDAIMMFFISAALYAWVRFRGLRGAPFSPRWWAWLAATGVAIGGATATKMVGLFTVATIGLVTVGDLWELADARRRALSDGQLARHFAARAACLIALPAALYVGSYWVHFAVLTRTGPGDAFMSPEFQAGLEGSALHGRSRAVRYGHTVRLKSRLEDMYLHSHEHQYPRVHEDGKVSSEGQQVTGYPVADANNTWRLLPAEALVFSSDVASDEALEPLQKDPASGAETGGSGRAALPYDPAKIPGDRAVRDGDEVVLLHVQTGRALYTHDVASPLTRTNMEVTAVAPGAAADRDALLWRVEIKAGAGSDGVLRAHACHLRLVNRRHGVVLTNWQQPLPKWGFGQREVNGDKRSVAENTRWIVWDVEEPMDAAEQHAMESRPRVRLSFLQKLFELQATQLRANATLVDQHPFRSTPASWPFVTRGVSYWDRAKSARVYLLGNPLAWYLALAGTLAFAATAVRQLWTLQRGGIPDRSDRGAARLRYRLGFLALAWALHYAPFFTMARTLYLHHYLPAYIISAMLAGGMAGYVLDHARRPALARAVLLALGAAVVVVFFYFAPLTYGTQASTDSLASKRWMSSWDFP